MWGIGILIFILCFIFMADIAIILDLLFTLIINKIFPDKEENDTKSFVGSLCHMGLRGGGLYVDKDNFTYKNKSATIPDEFKELVIPLRSITKVEKSRVLFFPAVKVHMGKYKTYKFVVFNRPLFLKMTVPNYTAENNDMQN